MRKVPEIVNEKVEERYTQGVSEKYPTCVYIFAPERSIGLCEV